MALSKVQSNSILDGAITASDLHASAVSDKLGYTYSPVNKSGFGYNNWADQATSNSINNNQSTPTLIGTNTFTIPATSGVSSWTVIANCSWTGNMAGHRLWAYVTLDRAHGSGQSAADNTNTSINQTGWSEHGWMEMDLSVGAFSWNQSATWSNVSAGEHNVRLYAYANSNSHTCWRRGISVIWIPAT